jgi:hypothetical protein
VETEEEVTNELGPVEGWIECLFGVAEERGSRRHTRKWMGRWPSRRFCARALELGLVVLKPRGDTARYDFGGGFRRAAAAGAG